MSKWKTETTKGGTEINITNGKYYFHLGEAFNNKLEFDAIIQRDLIEDAELFCEKLNFVSCNGWMKKNEESK